MPRISVITPLYNAELYLEEAMRSVLGQTFGDFEYLIANDGSKDGSLAIARKLEAEDGRVRVIDLGENRGNSYAMNALLAEAKGDYIALMDADDVCHRERLAKQVAYLDSHPEVALVGTQYKRLSPAGKVLRKTRTAQGDVTLPFKLMFSVPMCNPTQMFRREILDGIGEPYNTGLIGAQDFDFFLRALGGKKMHVLKEYLFFYRIHPASLSTTKKDKLMEETRRLSLAYMLAEYPQLAGHEALLQDFLTVQRDYRGTADVATVKGYCKGLDLLAAAYMEKLPNREKRVVKGFVAEMEAKTLLGRHKIFKQPKVLLAWLLGPNHLHWLPNHLG